MRSWLVGICVGMLIVSTPVLAYRMARPQELHEWNSNTFSQLNDILLQLWNISNGRMQLDRVTVDPDGSRPCSVGELVYFDTGTDQVCVCAVVATKKWNCWNAT